MRSGEVVAHTAISHRERNAMLACKHGNGCAAGEKIFHHLPGHVAGKRRHTARGNAVVGGADQHLRCIQMRLLASLNQCQLQSQRFELAERTLRFGFVVEQMLHACAQRSVIDVSKRGKRWCG